MVRKGMSCVIPMTSLLVVLVGAFAGTTPAAARSCLPYEPATVTLTGTLVSHQDLRSWWSLKLDQSACMVLGQSDPNEAARPGVAEMQVLFEGGGDYDQYRPLLKKRVVIVGKLTPWVTAYHMTPVMVEVSSISLTDGSQMIGPERQAASKPADLPNVQSYYASATVIQAAKRVATQAWQKDPADALQSADSWMRHFFNGPMDIMWVNCREGYAIQEARSSTNSAVFQLSEDNPQIDTHGVAVSDSGRTNITIRCVKKD
jgi:Domain of unknown function (DUF4431)